ncbi:recombinase family protein (plasmid) [Hymenobacter tibetensis]|uniref:Recombinase family protein n=1 Tax=Hymenobacter tibetensis TaxID=497967 RepID=A0ABY4DC52_9BACT|nr:recombinase family protein [Hymenobacter tibetensis]
MRQVVSELSARGVRLVAPDLGIDTLAGRLVLGIIAALAEYNRESIRERSAVGIALAKDLGRRPGVDEAKFTQVKKCLERQCQCT